MLPSCDRLPFRLKRPIKHGLIFFRIILRASYVRLLCLMPRLSFSISSSFCSYFSHYIVFLKQTFASAVSHKEKNVTVTCFRMLDQNLIISSLHQSPLLCKVLIDSSLLLALSYGVLNNSSKVS